MSSCRLPAKNGCNRCRITGYCPGNDHFAAGKLMAINSLDPSPPGARGPRLDTLPRCRRELAKLYHEARSGRLAPQDATRLASIVAMIARLIDGADLEDRLARLEAGLSAGQR
jgi:hypothetical protein